MINNHTHHWDLKNLGAFSSDLDCLEKNTFLFERQPNYQKEIEFGNILQSQLELNLIKPNDQTITTILKVLSLQYRIKGGFGGLDRLKDDAYDKAIVDHLNTVLKKWKGAKGQLYFDKRITSKDNEKIETLSRYPNFISILLKNEKITDAFFKLVFRDNFPIKLLIQYYKTCSEDLKVSLLAIRVGFFNKFDRQILKNENNILDNSSIKKDLKFLINGKFVTILDDNALIELNGDIGFTWKYIKELWENNKKFPAQMEVFENKGLICFKPQGLEYAEDFKRCSIDTTAPKFWEKLPIFLTMSKERLEKMLNIKITPDKPCVATIESSCMDPLFVDGAHGASTIYLPSEDGSSYQVFPFGKYAKEFPQSKLEQLSFLGGTVEAQLTYPDPTPFYTQRMHGVAPHLITFDEAEKLLTMYGKDIWFFQFAGNNCSAEFQLIFEKVFNDKTNYFNLPMMETKQIFPLNYILPPMKYIPESLSTALIHSVYLLFGSFRDLSEVDEDGTVKKINNLLKSQFCKTQTLAVPGFLVDQINHGKINGVTYYGL